VNRLLVPVLHGVEAPNDLRVRPDEEDTLVTVKSVVAALERLGYEAEPISIGFELARLKSLAGRNPLAVFNLVEAIGGDDALAFLPCVALDHLKLPYTGVCGDAQLLIRSKVQTKYLLRLQGLPTPDWWEAGQPVPSHRKVIVKSVHQHASLGMDSLSVVRGRHATQEIAGREQRYDGRFFAEGFIEGREFNVAVMENRGAPRVLPIPEIRFDALPRGRPSIVDWEAKWDTEAPAYYQTSRRFGLELREPRLAQRLTTLALDCWRLFELNGYARVDFRVDRRGQPFILEINANPCLAPDAGFVASAAQAGMGYDELIRAILANAAADRPALTGPAPEQLAGWHGKRQEPAQDDGPRLHWRTEVQPEDRGNVAQLVTRTGMFSDWEVKVAVELVQERLGRGAASGYEFLLADHAGTLAGYACYGPNAVSENGYELYWIAVDPRYQGCGLGRRLLYRIEQAALRAGGRTMWVETSSTEHFEPTRKFYRRNGYRKAAELKDFYRPGDNKVILAKGLEANVKLMPAAEHSLH
jgi:D-alanine-D-alanine ligase-like ATP-grasp enzyme/GNAT superfamily N-acetyltransferase